MLYFRIEELLKKKNKSKYWLCQNMNITSHNLNRVIRGETTSISFKYLEELCEFLDCSLDELIEIDKKAQKKYIQVFQVTWIYKKASNLLHFSSHTTAMLST